MSGVQSRGGGMVAGGFAAAAMGEDGGTVMAGAGSCWSGKAATQSGAPGRVAGRSGLCWMQRLASRPSWTFGKRLRQQVEGGGP